MSDLRNLGAAQLGGSDSGSLMRIQPRCGQSLPLSEGSTGVEDLLPNSLPRLWAGFSSLMADGQGLQWSAMYVSLSSCLQHGSFLLLE